MSAKADPQIPAALLERYRAAVGATPGAEVKGAAMPCTSLNGNMYSFLDKQGVAAVRLGAAERAALTALGGEPYIHETGFAMKEYMSLPPAVLADTSQAAAWLGKSLAYANTLKPKATTRKKSA